MTKYLTLFLFFSLPVADYVVPEAVFEGSGYGLHIDDDDEYPLGIPGIPLPRGRPGPSGPRGQKGLETYPYHGKPYTDCLNVVYLKF